MCHVVDGWCVKFTWGLTPLCPYITRLLEVLLVDMKTIASLLCPSAWLLQPSFFQLHISRRRSVTFQSSSAEVTQAECAALERHTLASNQIISRETFTPELPETKSCSRQTGLAVEARSNKSKLPVFHSLLWCLIPFLCCLIFTHKHTDVSVSAWFSLISHRDSHGNHSRCCGLYFCCTRLFWLVRFECLFLCWLEFPPKFIQAELKKWRKRVSRREEE